MFASDEFLRNLLGNIVWSADTRGHERGGGEIPFVCNAKDACRKESTQAGAHEADWGIKIAQFRYISMWETGDETPTLKRGSRE